MNRNTIFDYKVANVLQPLLVFMFLMASIGPIVRSNNFPLIKITGALIIVLSICFVLVNCKLFSLWPTLFGLSYTSILIVHSLDKDWYTSFIYFGYGLLATSIINIKLTKFHIMPIMVIIFTSSVIVSLSSIIEYKTGINLLTGKDILIHDNVVRATGLYGNPSATAGFIITGLITSVFVIVNFKSFIRIINLFLIPIYIWGLYCTASRGAVVAFGFTMLLLLIKSNLNLTKKIIIISLITVFIGNYGYLSQGRSMSLSDDKAGMDRVNQYLNAMNRFEINPFVGHLSYEDNYIENNYLQILADGGLLAFIPFLIVHILAFYYSIIKPENIYKFMFGLIFISMAFMGISHNWLNNVLYWMIIGLCLNNKYHPQQ